MCGGKGGDLAKVAESGVSFTFLVDISVESVREARRRWLNDRQRGRRHVPRAAFVVADVGTISFLEHEPIASWLASANSPGRLPARTVSCQMAMHYCFDTEERARRFLANVSACLAPGGTFVGTMIDSARLVARIRSQGKPILGNTLYRVDTRATPAILSGEGCPVFGAAYSFSLQDAVDDCVEYLVHWPTLVSLAADVGLEPVMLRNFHTYLADAIVPPDDPDQPLPAGQARALKELESRGVFGNQGGSRMSDEEWEVAGLYAAFAFRKRGAPDATATAAPDAFTVDRPLPAALADDVVDLFSTKS
jgi:mRNA (guanine-N7-)-methyltransferase